MVQKNIGDFVPFMPEICTQFEKEYNKFFQSSAFINYRIEYSPKSIICLKARWNHLILTSRDLSYPIARSNSLWHTESKTLRGGGSSASISRRREIKSVNNY